MRPNGQHIGYCTVAYIVLHPLLHTSSIQHQNFLNEIDQNFEEQVEDFFNVTSNSLVKKTRPSSLNLTQPLTSTS